MESSAGAHSIAGANSIRFLGPFVFSVRAASLVGLNGDLRNAGLWVGL